MDIKLNFVNRSNDRNNSDILIFQKNPASGFDELAVAWLVIRNCPPGGHHPFVFPEMLTVDCRDSWGNFTPRLDASPGQLFAMRPAPSGDVLVPAGEASVPTEVQVLNDLPQRVVDACLYRDDKLVALKTGLAPQRKAAFWFKPTIWIGAVSLIEQGEVINPAIISSVTTVLSLEGLASADIVMTGGGPGKNSTPFVFKLENVVYA